MSNQSEKLAGDIRAALGSLNNDAEPVVALVRQLVDRVEKVEARVAGIQQIIATEPELPGEMPAEMWQAFVDAINEGDRAFVMTALRVAVKETKDCILERIREADRAGGEK